MRILYSFASWAALRTPPSIGMSIDPRNIVDIPCFAGTGVMSILPVPSTSGEYYVGTKRGKVKRIALPANSLRDDASLLRTIQACDVEDADGKTLKPYPIFSLASVANREGHDLLAGGGDRYVTVWRKGKRHGGRVDARTVWKVEEQLGPHTGWVKDMAQQTASSRWGDETLVFSIGCNCIEAWSHAGGEYRHRRKLQIESSVEMGCTLSSDLLCLATYSEVESPQGGGDGGARRLLAGGVDGRIHRWTMVGEDAQFSNAGAVSAHDGRVNAMTVCNGMNALVSVGNDGYVRCSMMDDRDPSRWDTTGLAWGDGRKKLRRITSLCIVRDEPIQAIVAAGTSCGKISLIQINKTIGNAPKVSFLKDGNSVGSEDGEGCAIHALCGVRQGNFCRMVIGHSAGLSVWDLSL